MSLAVACGRLFRRGPLLVALCAGSALAAAPAHAGVNTWTTGGPTGAIAREVVVDPATPSTVYAATNQGVQKSVNGGANWVARNGGLPTQSVLDLAINPSSPSVLWVTADTNGLGTYRPYKTTAAAEGVSAWSEQGSGTINSSTLAVAVSPTAPDTVYVGGFAVWKQSTSGGAWSPLGAVSAGAGVASVVQALAVDPASASIVYAGTGSSGASGQIARYAAGWTTPGAVTSTSQFVRAVRPNWGSRRSSRRPTEVFSPAAAASRGPPRRSPAA